MQGIINLINVATKAAQAIGLAYAGFIIVPHWIAIMRKNTQKVEEGKDAVGRTLVAVAGIYLSMEVIQFVVTSVGGG